MQQQANERRQSSKISTAAEMISDLAMMREIELLQQESSISINNSSMDLAAALMDSARTINDNDDEDASEIELHESLLSDLMRSMS